ncbi:hypothetical protein BCR33DRAFT_724271, partial [Rhizoclosmatium globosum]
MAKVKVSRRDVELCVNSCFHRRRVVDRRVAVLVVVVGAVVVRRRTRIQSAIVRSTSNNPNFEVPRIELGNEKNEV